MCLPLYYRRCGLSSLSGKILNLRDSEFRMFHGFKSFCRQKSVKYVTAYFSDKIDYEASDFQCVISRLSGRTVTSIQLCFFATPVSQDTLRSLLVEISQLHLKSLHILNPHDIGECDIGESQVVPMLNISKLTLRVNLNNRFYHALLLQAPFIRTLKLIHDDMGDKTGCLDWALLKIFSCRFLSLDQLTTSTEVDALSLARFIVPHQK